MLDEWVWFEYEMCGNMVCLRENDLGCFCTVGGM